MGVKGQSGFAAVQGVSHCRDVAVGSEFRHQIRSARSVDVGTGWSDLDVGMSSAPALGIQAVGMPIVLTGGSHLQISTRLRSWMFSTCITTQRVDINHIPLSLKYGVRSSPPRRVASQRLTVVCA
jgi:hypothetical protein